VVTSSADATARVWDTQTGQCTLDLTENNPIGTAVFSPDGKFILTSAFRGDTRVWDRKTGTIVTTLQRPPRGATIALYDPPQTKIALGSDDTLMRIWDAAGTRELAVLRGHEDSAM